MTTPALKFRDMILSKFKDGNEKTETGSSSEETANKSRLSFSVDSLLKKKFADVHSELF